MRAENKIFSPDFRKKKFFQKKIFPQISGKKNFFSEKNFSPDFRKKNFFFRKKFFPRFQEKKIFSEKNFSPDFRKHRICVQNLVKLKFLPSKGVKPFKDFAFILKFT